MAKEKIETNPQRELSLIGHLDELRMRLIICVVTLFVSVFFSFYFASPVLEFLIKPVTVILSKHQPVNEDNPTTTTLTLALQADGSLRGLHLDQIAAAQSLDSLDVLIPADLAGTTRTLTLIKPAVRPNKIIYPSPLDPFMMLFKVAIILGILMSLVVWVWQIWLFISPGLTEKEKKVIKPLLLGTIFLFPIGALFAYYLIFLIIAVMQNYIVPGIDILYNITEYLKLMTTMMIVFGVIFELPLVMALLARIGIVTPAFLKHYRRHIYVGLAVVAMILTPADPFSMMAVFVPLIGLFEISYQLVKPMAYLRARAEAELDEATDA